MLYLNAVSFQGLWRVNANGGYNVPFGKVSHPSICDGDELSAISEHLVNAKLACASFEAVINTCSLGTVLFCDPPYHSGFDSYTPGGFTDEQQLELADCLQRASFRGAKIFATNAATPLIRAAYRWASVEEIAEERSIAANGKKRQAAPCLLIRA